MRTRRSPAPAPSQSRIALAVVESDSRLRGRLMEELEVLGAVTGHDTLDGLEAEGTGQPTVMVLGPSLSRDEALDKAGGLARARSNVGIVAVPEELTTRILQSAMRLGIAYVVSLEEEPDDLRDAVKRVGEGLASRPFGDITAPPSVDEPANGKVITVFSAKGGVGKSMVAVNLATLLAQTSERPVVLVDADLQFGDVCLMAGVTPSHTVVDAVAAGEQLDAALLDSLLAVEQVSGLRILAAPLEPGFADQIDPVSMSRVIDLLRTMCSHVVIDTCASFNEIVLGLLDTSDEIVIVAGMDVPSVKNVKIGVQTLRLLNLSVSKVKLVLNRANSRVGLEVADVERTLQLKADVALPSDIIVPQSVNRGVPVVVDAPKSKVARGLQELAMAVSSTDASQRPALRKGSR